MNNITKLYNNSIENPMMFNSIDIFEHLKTLKQYGEECGHITEMGVRWGSSTLAFIMAEPDKLVSYDIQSTPEIQNILKESQQLINHDFILADTLNIEIDNTELLFIDTLHTYNQLKKELELHSPKVSKYIILHDTTTFGRVNEVIYNHASSIIKNLEVNKTGLRTAMEDFLNENNDWEILMDKTNNNGLTILKRKNE